MSPKIPSPPSARRGGPLDRALRGISVIYLVVLLAAIIAYKAVFVGMLTVDPWFTLYGIVVCAYIVTRFMLSLFYKGAPDAGLEPRVAIVMPGFNEEAAIAGSLRSLLALDYPSDKLEIVAVNDGSTDSTLAKMQEVAAEFPGRVHVIDLGTNQGKRAAMAAGIRATEAEIIAFVDSDSVLEPDALTILVQGFADETVGAI